MVNNKLLNFKCLILEKFNFFYKILKCDIKHARQKEKDRQLTERQTKREKEREAKRKRDT